ncbi:MAG TPA: hypothetical protein VGN88_00960 [Phycisphaerae bacterium]
MRGIQPSTRKLMAAVLALCVPAAAVFADNAGTSTAPAGRGVAAALASRSAATSAAASKGPATAASAATGPAATGPATATAPAAVKIPATVDEVKLAIDHGDYVPALNGIARILDPKHPLDYDRQALLFLRVECQVQLKQMTVALDSLEGIRKTAHQNAAKTDEAQAAAFIFLIHKSPALLYTPKTAVEKIPINILDRTARLRAYDALYADELAVTQQMAKEAALGTSLAPILKTCDELYSVQAVERLSTGDIVNTKKVAQQLVDAARTIITSGELADDRDLVSISVAANRQVTVRTGVNISGGRGRAAGSTQYRTQVVGLGAGDQRRLGEISSDCDGILDLIGRLRIMIEQADALAGIFDRASALKINVQSVNSGNVVQSLGAVPSDTPGAAGGRGRGRGGRGRGAAANPGNAGN